MYRGLKKLAKSDPSTRSLVQIFLNILNYLLEINGLNYFIHVAEYKNGGIEWSGISLYAQICFVFKYWINCP